MRHDEESARAAPQLTVIAGQVAKAFPYLPSAMLVIAGALLAAYGLFDLAAHYQSQGSTAHETIFGHRLASHGVGATSFLAGVALIAIGANLRRLSRN